MDKELQVFNIERFGIADGPGIRTVVFFKGCYLTCKWCANPESQKFQPEILVKDNICISCEKCIEVCPASAIQFREGYGYISNNSLCVLCGKCVEVCPVEARELIGKKYSEKKLLEEILKDKEYFIN